MKILMSPCVNEGKKINYSFNGEVIKATIDGVEDVFDFTSFTQDGEVNGVETTLPYDVVIVAKRENGVLSVELLNFISSDATEQECFPEWVEV